MILDLSSGKILVFLLESCSLGGPVTCAMTQLQYLNVSRSTAGVTQLRTARAWAAGKCFRKTYASFHWGETVSLLSVYIHADLMA